MSQLTREEIEQRLEQKYLGAVVSIELPKMAQWMWEEAAATDAQRRKFCIISGKIQRIAVELVGTEPMVVFTINHTQYKADVNYFIENITIHGDTHRRTT